MMSNLTEEVGDQMKNGSANKSIAVVVVSCDKYADLWTPFFFFLKKFWPDCPHKVYLISNHHSFEDSSIVCIRVGDDISWSGNLRLALNAINEDYVIMFLDDLFLMGPVDTRQLTSIYQTFIALDGNCVKLAPTVRGDRAFNGILTLSTPGAPYRASTVLTMWKKNLLRDLLLDGENAWQFEIEGSKRSDVYDGFYVAKAPVFRVENCVVKGRWSLSALKKVKVHCPTLSPNRKVMTLTSDILFHVALLRSRVITRILPHRYARSTMDALRRFRDRFLRKGY
jgi:hypothetical protein